MKIINFKNTNNKTYSATIGIFDSLHMGHRRILRKLKNPSILITFFPNPKTKEYILPISERLRIFKRLGIEKVIILEERDGILSLDTKSFIEKIIIPNNINRIVVGKDFKLGKNRKTDVFKFKELLEDKKIKLDISEILKDKNGKISSSNIRADIKNGFLEKYKYFIKGVVVKGKGIGKNLGFKTANIKPKRDQIIPKTGVYITKTEIDKKTYNSATYIGTSPTISKSSPTIETYIFDFNKDIYGKKIKILFKKRLRDEIKFKNIDELINAIQKDINTCINNLQ